MGIERGDKARERGAAPGNQRQNNGRQPEHMPGLEFRLTNLPFPQPLAGDDRRGGAEGVARQVNQRRHRKSNEVAGDNVGAHPGDEHLGQQLTAIEQNRFDTGRDADPHHLPDNGEVKGFEVAFQRQPQRGIEAHHQHPDSGDGANIAGNGQPETGADKAQPRP